MKKLLRAARTTFRWLRRAAVAAIGLAALALLLAQFRAPENDRDWEPPVSRAPDVAAFDGNLITVENFRDFRWKTASEPASQTWRTETLDLRGIDAADFIVVPLSDGRAAAHTMLSFEFKPSSGETQRVVVSMEARRERDEPYSTWRGLGNEYELIYVVGSEEDLVALRGVFRGDELYRYPINATPEALRALFANMLLTADELRTRPEFYGTLWNSCTTRIAMHVRQATGYDLPFSWRYVIPGYSGELIYDLGLTGDGSVPFPELEASARIGQKVRDAYGKPNFSEVIRR